MLATDACFAFRDSQGLGTSLKCLRTQLRYIKFKNLGQAGIVQVLMNYGLISP